MYDNILRLQIPMDNILRMQIGDGIAQLIHNNRDLFLSEEIILKSFCQRLLSGNR